LDFLRGVVALSLVESPVAGQLRLVIGARHAYQRRQQATHRHQDCALYFQAESLCHHLSPFPSDALNNLTRCGYSFRFRQQAAGCLIRRQRAIS
jgi:hypothetical protein